MAQVISDIEEIRTCTDNQIILKNKESFSMKNSKIRFTGTNNILYCEPDVHLVNCNLHFDASNSVIYLSSSTHFYKTNITVFNNCSCYIGKDCYFNGVINIICSEETNVFLGRQSIAAFGIWIRTADPHLVYSGDDNKRINPSKSVYIGDHVWIGQNALILKGSQVHSGSIIGAGTVLAGQRIPSNASYVGNPAKQIADNIYWDEKVVHKWTKKETENNKYYQGETPFLFEPVEGETQSFRAIDKALYKSQKAEDKLKYIKSLAKKKKKNRFSWKKSELPVTFRKKVRLLLKKWILRIMK